MANVLTVKKAGTFIKDRFIRYGCVLSGNYVAAVRGSNVGEVLDLTSITGKFDPMQYWGQSGPAVVYVLNGPAGYAVEILPGADGLHWLLKVFASPGVEFTVGAYSAGLLADVDFQIEAQGADWK